LCSFVQVALGAADRLVDKRDAPGKPDAPRPGMEFEKLPVRQAGYYHHLFLGYIGLHGDSVGWKGKTKYEPGKVFPTGKCPLRISGFGLPSGFGPRVSGFVSRALAYPDGAARGPVHFLPFQL
jgi:hypothetical protein